MSFFGGPPTVLQRLNTGLERRTALDTQFQLDLFNRILELLRELQQCPAAIGALPPGTAGALTITEAELVDFIQRLENPNNMGPEDIEDIVDPIYSIGRNGDNSLRRAPGAPVRSSASSVPRARTIRARAPTSPSSPSSGTRSWLPWKSAPDDTAPGSYKPPAQPTSASSIWPWSKTPKSDIADSQLDDLAGGPSGLPAPDRPPPAGSRFGPGAGGRRTRRARKYRNRT